MSKQIKYFLTIFALTLFVGCAPIPIPIPFSVDIDSISASQDNLKKYILLPALKGVTESDLQFKEFSTYIKEALNSKGYINAEDKNDAEIAILVLYGISSPQHKTSSVPIFGKTGISSSSTFGNIRTFGSTSTYSGTTSYKPTYGIVGSIPVTRTQYTRYLVLDAYDLDELRQSKKAIEVWKTTVISSGSSGDLRWVFPYLITASIPYIGTNTGKQVSVTLYENDKRVLEIKGLK